MSRRIAPVVTYVVATLSILAPVRATEITGTWSGTYSAVFSRCNPPLQTSGAIGLHVVQNGSTFSGNLTVEKRQHDCTPTPLVVITQIVSGSVSGNSFSGTIFYPFGDGETSASVSGTFDDTGMSACARRR